MTYFHEINPIMFEIFSIKLYWYGFMYALSFVIIDYLIVRAAKIGNIEIDLHVAERLTLVILLFAIVGGRIGYILFYDFNFYLNNIEQIFFIWNGGLSFHGGLIGTIVGAAYFTKNYKIDFYHLTDVIARYAPIGLFFGRIGNFINSELYGIKTSGNWGVIFSVIDNNPRHPSMLYEAFLEGLVLFLILAFISKWKPAYGVISGYFLLFYGVFRFLVEFVRLPDAHIGYIYYDWMTMGHLLSMPMIFIGLIIIYRRTS
ncbi:MAG: prolipoprotein diacylglyceryl transferase [Gammaproteobacteria bacterium]